ncbi:hypothetical protein EV360DRAFT_71966 [Lentinula raphanica]|nr:hypothetical protein EV360DRAFT_71966 [Lentinula raphanica]
MVALFVCQARFLAFLTVFISTVLNVMVVAAPVDLASSQHTPALPVQAQQEEITSHLCGVFLERRQEGSPARIKGAIMNKFEIWDICVSQKHRYHAVKKNPTDPTWTVEERPEPKTKPVKHCTNAQLLGNIYRKIGTLKDKEKLFDSELIPGIYGTDQYKALDNLMKLLEGETILGRKLPETLKFKPRVRDVDKKTEWEYWYTSMTNYIEAKKMRTKKAKEDAENLGQGKNKRKRPNSNQAPADLPMQATKKVQINKPGASSSQGSSHDLRGAATETSEPNHNPSGVTNAGASDHDTSPNQGPMPQSNSNSNLNSNSNSPATQIKNAMSIVCRLGGVQRTLFNRGILNDVRTFISVSARTWVFCKGPITPIVAAARYFKRFPKWHEYMRYDRDGSEKIGYNDTTQYSEKDKIFEIVMPMSERLFSKKERMMTGKGRRFEQGGIMGRKRPPEPAAIDLGVECEIMDGG